MSETRRKRYACYTEEQQKQFDSLTIQQQKYVIFRAQGMTRAAAYQMAGYKKSKFNGQSANAMEHYKNPEMVDLISAMSGVGQRASLMNPTSEASQKINKRVKTLETELPPELSAMIPLAKGDEVVPMRPMEVDKISDETAKNIHFYRQIAEGKIETVRKVTTYDKDGHVTGSRVEETSDIDTRIKAQKELARILGLKEVVELGRATAGNINIMIVDASRNADEGAKIDLTKETEVIEAEEVVENGETQSGDSEE